MAFFYLQAPSRKSSIDEVSTADANTNERPSTATLREATTTATLNEVTSANTATSAVKDVKQEKVDDSTNQGELSAIQDE